MVLKEIRAADDSRRTGRTGNKTHGASFDVLPNDMKETPNFKGTQSAL